MERNRQTKMIAIIALVIAVAGMSLGFAAFSSKLNISSSASVTPDSSTFSVGFYPDSTAALANAPASPVIASTTGGTSASDISVEEGSSTIQGLNANFTAPGGSATYSFYVGNSGEYDAYLKSVTYDTLDNGNYKKCIASTNATNSLVQAACEGIVIKVVIGGANYNIGDIISGHKLTKKTYEPITITLEYASSAERADGPFNVEFSSIKLDYSTVDNNANTIKFTINGEIYYAEQGMTHLDWFESSYNTLYDDITTSFCDGENKWINERDVLINNEEYYLGDSYCF